MYLELTHYSINALALKTVRNLDYLARLQTDSPAGLNTLQRHDAAREELARQPILAHTPSHGFDNETG
jgi:hypothetical protein